MLTLCVFTRLGGTTGGNVNGHPRCSLWCCRHAGECRASLVLLVFVLNQWVRFVWTRGQDYFIHGTNSWMARDWTPGAIAEGVLTLLHNDSLREHMGRSAHDFVSKYLSSDVTAPRVLAQFV